MRALRHQERGRRPNRSLIAAAALQPPKPDGTTTVTETLKWSWTSYNATQIEEKHRFAALLSELCWGVPEPEQVRGRPRLPLGDMVFAAVLKVYVGFSSRRFTADLRDAHSGGLIRSTPHFNSVSRYLSDPQLTDVLKNLVTVSSLPLKAVETDFAVDSSGFSTSRFVRWFNKKYGRETDNREWVKCHLMYGVRTKIVTSVDISGWTANDTSYFVPLVERTAEHFQIREVSADKAYLSRKNLNAVERVGGTAYVPFKSTQYPPTKIPFGRRCTASLCSTERRSWSTTTREVASRAPFRWLKPSLETPCVARATPDR